LRAEPVARVVGGREASAKICRRDDVTIGLPRSAGHRSAILELLFRLEEDFSQTASTPVGQDYDKAAVDAKTVTA